MSRWRPKRPPKGPSRGAREAYSLSITDAAAPFVTPAEAEHLLRTHVQKTRHVAREQTAVSNFLHGGVPVSIVTAGAQAVVALTSEVDALL